MNARPAQSDEKKGADKGIDDRLYMTDREGGDQDDHHLAQGRARDGAGNPRSGSARSAGVIEREDAAIGVFITLETATAPMRKEAAEAGFWQTKSLAGSKHPRLQILSIEELLAGKRIDMPAQQEIRSFKQAPKAKGKKSQQSEMF